MELTITKVAMPDQLTKEEVKQAIKDGIKDWMNERFAEFGKWSLGGICAAGLGILGWLLIISNGWHK